MFEIGEMVIKANTGVCRITEITSMEQKDCGNVKQYYVLEPLTDQKSKLFVPVDSESSNMRRIMTSEAAWDMIRHMGEIESVWIANDRQREQEYKNAIRKNEPEALVSIIKNIYLRGKQREEQGKRFTAVDERYFKIAEAALHSELAAAIGRNPEEIEALIEEYINGTD